MIIIKLIRMIGKKLINLSSYDLNKPNKLLRRGNQ